MQDAGYKTAMFWKMQVPAQPNLRFIRDHVDA
jgi:hypothetical protein